MIRVFQLNSTRFLIAALVLLGFSRIEAGSWIDIPLPDLVNSEKVIITGKLGPVEDVKKGEHLTGRAVGLIEVTKVVKNTQEGLELKVGDTIELVMPSPNSRIRKSIDLIYREGQEGVWLLAQNKDGQFEATYPKDFQPLDKLAEIEGLVKAAPAKK